MNNETIVFHPLLPAWIAVMLVILYAIIFVTREIQTGYRFRLARMGATMLMLLSLLLWLLHPAIQQLKTQSDIILLTKGYDKKIVDSLVKQHFDLPIFKTKDAANFSNAKSLNLYGSLEKPNEVSGFILGDGLPIDVLDAIDKKSFQYFVSAYGTGVTEISFDRFYTNRRNEIKGTFNADKNGGTLRLVSPDGTIDSIVLKSEGLFPFTLKFVARQAGRFIYSFESKQNGFAKLSADLPIEVLPEKPIRILIIQQYPTAEIRYLKNYLVGHKHSLVVRYQVSKNLYHYEYSNTTKNTLPQINSKTLQDFDLVVIDPGSFAQLSVIESKALELSVQEGLGLLLLFKDSPATTPLLKVVNVVKGVAPNDTLHLITAEGKNLTLLAYPAKTDESQDVSDILKSGDRIISGFTSRGAGKIGFQFLHDTYQLMLKGESHAYDEVWTPLIERTARTVHIPFKIKIASPFPLYSENPIKVDVISAGKSPDLYLDSIHVSLIEDLRLDNLWHGKIRVKNKGWHQLHISGDSISSNFYVSDSTEWTNLNLVNQTIANAIVASPLEVSNGRSHIQEVEIPQWIFFISFLLAAGFLWLSPKL